MARAIVLLLVACAFAAFVAPATAQVPPPNIRPTDPPPMEGRPRITGPGLTVTPPPSDGCATLERGSPGDR